MRLERWVSAVFKLMPKDVATSRLLFPSAINLTISLSRGVIRSETVSGNVSKTA